MKEINLYIIRHGETEWNLKELMQGSKNSPLTEKGVSDAKQTGEYLRQTPFLCAYSSPQQRAIDTRDHIIGQFDSPVNTFTHHGLKEMDFGLWEGYSISELYQYQEFKHYLELPEKYDPTGNCGEHYLQVLERMRNGLESIVNSVSEDRGNILIVSHGTAIRLLLCVLSGGDWRKHRDVDYFPRTLNTSISLVNYRQEDNQKNGHYSVKYYNSVEHLK